MAWLEALSLRVPNKHLLAIGNTGYVLSYVEIP